MRELGDIEDDWYLCMLVRVMRLVGDLAKDEKY